MACCAFVAFLVSQAFLMVQAVLRWFHGERAVPVPSAVMWRLQGTVAGVGVSGAGAVPGAHAVVAATPIGSRGGPTTSRRVSRTRAYAMISLAALIELGVAAGGVQWLRTTAGSFADFNYMCLAKR